MRRRILWAFPPMALLSLLLVTTVLAVVSYSAPLSVVESNGTDYTMLAVFDTVDNQWLADNDFMAATALDTRVETLGGLTKPHMVAADRTLTAIAVPADSQTNLRFTTNNSALSAMDIITGYGGYVTVSDAAALELGGTFQTETDGYVDTSNAANKDLVYKQNSFRTYISGATDISSVASVETALAPAPFSSTSDGRIVAGNAVYATAHDAATGTIDDTSAQNNIGQLVSGTYFIYRGFFFFDTSAIPDGATIVTATLYLYGQADHSTTDFDLVIRNGQPTYPHDPLAVGDYLYSHYAGDGGSFNTSGFSVAGYNAITLNATGLGWISDTGTTKLAVISSRDIASIAPTGDEYVTVYNAEQAGTNNDPYLAVGYLVDTTVTANGVASGEHVVKTTSDGANLKIYIDGSEEDSTAFTDNVYDSSYDWILARNDVAPYMDYYKHTVGGTLIAHYEPVTMISGTTLPDREGAAQNGTITWGSNPAGVTVSLDSLEVAGVTEGVDTGESDTVDVLPEIEVSDFYVDPDVAGALLTNPLRPLVTMMSDTTTLRESQAWKLLGLALILAVTVITTLAVGGHQGITMIAAGAALLGTVILTIFPLWMLVFCVGMFIGGLVMERTPAL